jgi:hypothetical protein
MNPSVVLTVMLVEGGEIDTEIGGGGVIVNAATAD